MQLLKLLIEPKIHSHIPADPLARAYPYHTVPYLVPKLVVVVPISVEPAAPAPSIDTYPPAPNTLIWRVEIEMCTSAR